MSENIPAVISEVPANQTVNDVSDIDDLPEADNSEFKVEPNQVTTLVYSFTVPSASIDLVRIEVPGNTPKRLDIRFKAPKSGGTAINEVRNKYCA